MGSVTKPIAKVLDKIVPNEIKPALPFVAAAVPFMLPGSFAVGGLGSLASRAIAAAGANAVSQLSQEGAAERGLNPVSLGLAGLSGYLSGPSAGQQLGFMKTAYVPEGIMQGIDSAGQIGIAGSPAMVSTPLSIGQQATNIGANLAQYGADTLGTGAKAFENIVGGTSANVGTDFLNLGKAYVPGALQASGELAYNAALDANKKYQDQLASMGALASANRQQQIDYIRSAMQSAGFNEDEIINAITRSGFANGGRVAYGLGSFVKGNVVKPAMQNLKRMKNKVVDFISKMTDDIEIRTQTDYADDSGASFDIYITPKTEKGRNTLDQISQMGLAEKSSDGTYFINDLNLEEATMSLNERGIKASGVYEPTAKGEEFESFRTAGQGPYGVDYYGYDRLKEGLRGPKRPPMDKVDYDTIPSPTDKPEGFAQGGLMNLGGMEMDFRAKGGFVPIGRKERADDVPARLSKNEFVFTAKAVRNAGGGDIRKGAKRMYQIMNQLEAIS